MAQKQESTFNIKKMLQKESNIFDGRNQSAASELTHCGKDTEYLLETDIEKFLFLPTVQNLCLINHLNIFVLSVKSPQYYGCLLFYSRSSLFDFLSLSLSQMLFWGFVDFSLSFIFFSIHFMFPSLFLKIFFCSVFGLLISMFCLVFFFCFVLLFLLLGTMKYVCFASSCYDFLKNACFSGAPLCGTFCSSLLMTLLIPVFPLTSPSSQNSQSHVSSK